MRVLADQATETIAPHHLRADSGGWWLRRPEWWRLSQRAVRPMRVVVINIFGQHRLQSGQSADADGLLAALQLLSDTLAQAVAR